MSDYPLGLPGLPWSSTGRLDLPIGFYRKDFPLSLMSINDSRLFNVPKRSGMG
jgi:hypothetical protein